MWVNNVWRNVVRMRTRGPDGAWRRGYVVAIGPSREAAK